MTATLTAQHTARETWLIAAIEHLRPLFEEAGAEIPAVRVSVGWPGGRGAKNAVIGQCWPGSLSEDGIGSIFVSPVLADASRVLDVLAHELVHAVNHAAGENGHGAPFARIAKKIGLEGKMTATVASEALKVRLDEIAAALGAYPHAILAKAGDGADGPKKQGTRMVKAECASGPDEDGEVYKVRLTRTWIEKVGAPICPCHGEPMTVEGA